MRIVIRRVGDKGVPVVVDALTGIYDVKIETANGQEFRIVSKPGNDYRTGGLHVFVDGQIVILPVGANVVCLQAKA